MEEEDKEANASTKEKEDEKQYRPYRIYALPAGLSVILKNDREDIYTAVIDTKFNRIDPRKKVSIFIEDLNETRGDDTEVLHAWLSEISDAMASDRNSQFSIFLVSNGTKFAELSAIVYHPNKKPDIARNADTLNNIKLVLDKYVKMPSKYQLYASVNLKSQYKFNYFKEKESDFTFDTPFITMDAQQFVVQPYSLRLQVTVKSSFLKSKSLEKGPIDLPNIFSDTITCEEKLDSGESIYSYVVKTPIFFGGT